MKVHLISLAWGISAGSFVFAGGMMQAKQYGASAAAFVVALVAVVFVMWNTEVSE